MSEEQQPYWKFRSDPKTKTANIIEVLRNVEARAQDTVKVSGILFPAAAAILAFNKTALSNLSLFTLLLFVTLAAGSVVCALKTMRHVNVGENFRVNALKTDDEWAKGFLEALSESEKFVELARLLQLFSILALAAFFASHAVFLNEILRSGN